VDVPMMQSEDTLQHADPASLPVDGATRRYGS
jgi:hypothetical protein